MARNNRERQFYGYQKYYGAPTYAFIPGPAFDPMYGAHYPIQPTPNINNIRQHKSPSKLGEELRRSIFGNSDVATQVNDVISSNDEVGKYVELSPKKMSSIEDEENDNIRTSFIALISSKKSRTSIEAEIELKVDVVKEVPIKDEVVENTKLSLNIKKEEEPEKKFVKVLEDASITNSKIIETHKKIPPVKVVESVPKEKAHFTPAKPVEGVKEKYLIGKEINGRRMYTVAEMLSILSKPECSILPWTLDKLNPNEPYLKTGGKKRKYQYTRSNNAWLSKKEKLKNVDKSKIIFEELKTRIQSSINKFTRNNYEVVYKELLSEDFFEPLYINIIIDCIFRSITYNGAYIMEFAKLADNFRKFQLKANSKHKTYFRDNLIEKFIAATEISKEWQTKYDNIKNKKITTIDELDIVNEELQSHERVMRMRLLGSAQFLAYMSISDTISTAESIEFIKKVKNRENELDAEMICCYLTIAGAKIKSVPNQAKLLKDTIEGLNRRKSRYSMRVNFLIDDLCSLQASEWKSKSKPHIKVSSITIPDMQNMIPERRRGAVVHHKAEVGVSSSSSATGNAGARGGDRKVIPGKVTAFGEKKKVSQDKKAAVVNEGKAGSGGSLASSNEINVTTATESLIPILCSYKSNYDTAAFILEFKDYELSHHMDLFIRLSFGYFVDEVKVSHICFGKLLATLFSSGRLDKVNFLNGFIEFMSSYNDIEVDNPNLSNVIARCIIPLIIYGYITIKEYCIVLDKFKINTSECIKVLISEMIDYTNVYTTCEVWIKSNMEKVYEDIIKENYPYLKESLLMNNYIKLYYDDEIGSGYVIMSQIDEELFDKIMKGKSEVFDKYNNDFIKLIIFSSPLTSDEEVTLNIQKIFEDNINIVRALCESEEGQYKFILNIVNEMNKYNFRPKNLISSVMNELKSLKILSSKVKDRIFEYILKCYSDEQISPIIICNE